MGYSLGFPGVQLWAARRDRMLPDVALHDVYRIDRKDGPSPADLADFAEEHGYVSEDEGTFAELLEFAAPELGLACEILPLRASSISTALHDGAVVICNVGPGEFTEAGHFFVIAGENEDARLSSTTRTQQCAPTKRGIPNGLSTRL